MNVIDQSQDFNDGLETWHLLYELGKQQSLTVFRALYYFRFRHILPVHRSKKLSKASSQPIKMSNSKIGISLNHKLT